MCWTYSEKFTGAVGEFIPLGQSTWGGGRQKASPDLHDGDGDETGQCWQPLEVAPFSQEHAR